MSAPGVVWAVFEKDLRAELRAREALVSMLVFAGLTVVVFNVAFAPTAAEGLRLAPGVLWTAFAFAGILGLNRSFALERESGALTALLLAPADRGAIYLGKMAANALLIVVLEATVLPVFAVLHNLSLLPVLPRLALVGLLGALGFSAAGTTFAAISGNTRMREVLTPLLLLPAAFPVLVAAVEGTRSALTQDPLGWPGSIRLLVVFTVAYATVSYLLFEYILEE